MNRIPFIPLGEAVICKKISNDMTRGGVYLPESAKDDKSQSLIIAEALAVPEGGYTQSGIRIPPEVAVGDIVAVPMAAAKKLGLSLSDQFLDRGIPKEEVDLMFVAFIPTIIGKFTANPATVLVTDGDAAFTGEVIDGIPQYTVKLKEVAIGFNQDRKE